MGLFNRNKSEQAEPMTFLDSIVHMGLPAGTIIREADMTWEMYCPKSDLQPKGDADCYPAKIINNGNSVTVSVGGKAVSKLDVRCLPEAVQALKQYGGKVAPAVLVLGRPGRKTDRVMVPKK